MSLWSIRADSNFLISAIAALVVSAAPLLAADIRGDLENGVVLEGTIEAGDYEKLRRVYAERRTNQFFIGMPEANELYLASPGGDLVEAIRIGRLVRALKLLTIVPARDEYPVGPYSKYSAADRHRLINAKANYMCASACFFIFVAGITRTSDNEFQDPRLGVHKPHLTDSDLTTLTGDQAINLNNRVRAIVENYLREMSVPAKYVDLMFSAPKDKILWLRRADFLADLEGTVPELRDWLAARCDKRTDVEKAVWEKIKSDPRPRGQYSTAERSIADKMSKKMLEMHDCERQVLNRLSGEAWLQMFDPSCATIAPEARSLAEDRTLCARKNWARLQAST